MCLVGLVVNREDVAREIVLQECADSEFYHSVGRNGGVVDGGLRLGFATFDVHYLVEQFSHEVRVLRRTFAEALYA